MHMRTARPVKSKRSKTTFRGSSGNDVCLLVNCCDDFDTSWSNNSSDSLRFLMSTSHNKKLSYRRGTARARHVSGDLVEYCKTIRKMSFEKTCNRRMIYKVIQGHWYRCHSIGHISLPL